VKEPSRRLKRASAAQQPSSATPRQETTWRPWLRLKVPSLRVEALTRDADADLFRRVVVQILRRSRVPQRECVLAFSVDAASAGSFALETSPDAEKLRDAIVSMLSDPSVQSREVDLEAGNLLLSLSEPRDKGKPRTPQILIGSVTDELPGEIRSAFDEHIASKLDDLPREFPARRAALRELHVTSREAIAKAFEAGLNAAAASMPLATYEEKKSLAKWVNAELRELGLTIRCPKTGEPAILRGGPGGVPGVGRFHLEITDKAGNRHRTVTSSVLPPLALMPDDLTRAPYGERNSKRSR
jgi:hypothetical protein